MFGFKRNLAVIIGINQYANGIAPLRTAVNDAQAIAKLLHSKHGYDVLLVLDQTATLEHLTGVWQKLPTLRKKTTPY